MINQSVNLAEFDSAAVDLINPYLMSSDNRPVCELCRLPLIVKHTLVAKIVDTPGRFVILVPLLIMNIIHLKSNIYG